MDKIKAMGVLRRRINKVARNEAIRKSRRWWLHPIGALARLAVYGGVFATLYVKRPADLWPVTLAQFTFVDVLKIATWVTVVMALLYFLFDPSRDDTIRDAWGWLGVVALCCGTLAGIVTVYGR